jgi:hypothetical protein
MTSSIETDVGTLLDNEQTKAILERHLPGLSTHPSIGTARGMPLVTVAQFSGGLITSELLAKVAEELAKL